MCNSHPSLLSIAGIREYTRGVLSSLIGPERSVSLLDFPSHTNAGDSLIWLGARRYLEQLGVQVRYTADSSIFDAAELRRRAPTGPILLNGGGNLGDLWPRAQKHREQVIVEFSERKIIQLPQSLHFQSSARLSVAQEIFSRHSDLTVLIRDHKGRDRAAELFPHNIVKFCPDTALGVADLVSTVEPRFDVVMLLRNDVESNLARHPQLPSSVRVYQTDWKLEGHDRLFWRLLALPRRLSRNAQSLRRLLIPILTYDYEASASLNVKSATRTLSLGRIVITDRLHAAILAYLLNVPVICLDNSYGKISAIYHDYLGILPKVFFAAAEADAVQIATALLHDEI